MRQDFALTPPSIAHSISPESSDGLPPLELFSLKREAALLPGGFFHLRPDFFVLPAIDRIG
jgi:hypothetical protein